MERLTINNDIGFSVPDSRLNEAIQRLAAFEDVYDELAVSMVAIPGDLAKLRAEGKEKTVRYKELFGQKMLNNHIIALFERHGIMFSQTKE